MTRADEIAEFDPTAAIEMGITLIEASAGTGKTYGITSMVLRLLAEEGLRIDSILVVTYTRAATAELRDRIRGRLVAAHEAGLRWLSCGGDEAPLDSGDPVIDHVYADPARRLVVVERLASALMEFERAAIFTIHGFCQHVLTRFGFEGGITPNLEVGESQDAILQEIVGDAMAANAVSCRDAAEWDLMLRAQGMGKAALLELASGPGRDPSLELIPSQRSTIEPAAGTAESGEFSLHETGPGLEWCSFLVDYFEGFAKRRAILIQELLGLGETQRVEGVQGPFHAKRDGTIRKSLETLLADLDALVERSGKFCAPVKDGDDDSAPQWRLRPSQRQPAVRPDPRASASLAAAWSECALYRAIRGKLLDPAALERDGELGPELTALHRLVGAASDATASARVEFVEFVRRELPRRTRERRRLSFDDLLSLVHARVMAPASGPPRTAFVGGAGDETHGIDSMFVRQVRDLYHAALIDEFQDTDAVQWQLFSKLFHRDDRRLILIGDPKQAIYGFRGADVDVYGVAKQATPSARRRSMVTNYRSDARYLAAVNRLFALHDDDNVFEVDGITAPAVHAPLRRSQDLQLLCSRGRPVAPLVLRWVDRDTLRPEPRATPWRRQCLRTWARRNAPGARASRPRPRAGAPRDIWRAVEARLVSGRGNPAEQMTRAEADAAIASAVAVDIALLLERGLAIGPPTTSARTGTDDGPPKDRSGGSWLRGRLLRAGDIAVLVSTNAQALAIGDALRRVGLRAVVPRAGSVFHGEEAQWLRSWLSYLCQPQHEARARAFALTPLGGWDAVSIVAARTSSPSDIGNREADAWLAWTAAVRDGARIIDRRGVQAALQVLMSTTRAGPRLAGQWRGERILTNLRHLGELLHRAHRSLAASLQGLLGWLEHQMAAPSQEDADDEQRLESDENAISITTIHKSKGLEYPVTFVPSLWLPRILRSSAYVAFRDPDLVAKRPGFAEHVDPDFPGNRSADASTASPPKRYADLRPLPTARGRERHRRLAAQAEFQESLRLAYVALTRARQCTFVYDCPRGYSGVDDGVDEGGEDRAVSVGDSGAGAPFGAKSERDGRSPLAAILMGGTDVASALQIQAPTRGARARLVGALVASQRRRGRLHGSRAMLLLLRALESRHPHPALPPRPDPQGGDAPLGHAAEGPQSDAPALCGHGLISYEARDLKRLAACLRWARQRRGALVGPRSSRRSQSGEQPEGEASVTPLVVSPWHRAGLRDAWTRTSYSRLLRGIESSGVSADAIDGAPRGDVASTTHHDGGSFASTEGRAGAPGDFALREEEDVLDHDLTLSRSRGVAARGEEQGQGSETALDVESPELSRLSALADNAMDDYFDWLAAVESEFEGDASQLPDVLAELGIGPHLWEFDAASGDASHATLDGALDEPDASTRTATMRLGVALAGAEPHSERAVEQASHELSWLNEECTLSRAGAGTQFGTLVHAVLEDLDFVSLRAKAEVNGNSVGIFVDPTSSADDISLQGRSDAAELDPSSLKRLIHAHASRIGARINDVALLARGIIQALDTPLGPHAGDLSLRQLSIGDRLDEFSFDLSIAGGDHWRAGMPGAKLSELLEIVAGRRDQAAVVGEARADQRLAHDELAGFLCGEIDLIYRVRVDGEWRFFVCDYKTNWLGQRGLTSRGERFARSTYAHYQRAALKAAMDDHRYDLQYHLYLLALHRYLRARLENYDYDRHIGGVAYLFLRGMPGAARSPQADLNAPPGVYVDRPPRARIEALDRWIAASTTFRAMDGGIGART